MFTGIVEEAGVIEKIVPGPQSIELTVRARVCGRGVKVGASVSVNGCCLTAVKLTPAGRDRLIRFDLLQESWNRTSFQHAQPGDLVNLERSVKASCELGGHFVTGHVDGLGRIKRWERAGKDRVLEVAAPREVMRYLVPKGSVAVDGISLTVSGVGRTDFQLWIIPHTYDLTALRAKKIGDFVNLEGDILGKYVERFLSARTHVSAKK